MKIIGPLHRNTEMPPASSSIRLSQRVTLPLHPDQSVSHAAKNIAHARQHSFPEIIKLVTLIVSVIGTLSLIAARASADQDLDAEEEAEDDIQNIDNIADLPPALLSSASLPETQVPVDDASQPDVQMTTFITPAHPVLTALLPGEISACSDTRQNDSLSGYDTDKPFSFGQRKEVVWPTKDVKTTISCHNTLRLNPAISLNISEGIRPDKTGSQEQKDALRFNRVQSVKTPQNATVSGHVLTAGSLKLPQRREKKACSEFHTENRSQQHNAVEQQATVQAIIRGSTVASLQVRTDHDPDVKSIPGNTLKYHALAVTGMSLSGEHDTVPAVPGVINIPDAHNEEAVVPLPVKQNLPSPETAENITRRLITTQEASRHPLFTLSGPNVLPPGVLRPDLQVSTPVISDPEIRLATQRKMVFPGYFRSPSPATSGIGQVSGPFCIKLCVIFIVLTVLFYR